MHKAKNGFECISAWLITVFFSQSTDLIAVTHVHAWLLGSFRRPHAIIIVVSTKLKQAGIVVVKIWKVTFNR